MLSRLPIRGYERVDLTFGTGNGKLTFGDNEGFSNPLYVTAIQDVRKKEGEESFTLALSSLENLMNETTRCQKKYAKANISAHVADILQDPNIFNISKEEFNERVEIEDCSTPYSFIGNNRKPFYILSWLCPKAQPLREGKAGGTSGFFFYETYDGYKFKSVDGLLAQTGELESKKVQSKQSPTRAIETYTGSSLIDSAPNPENNFQILSYMMDSATNLQKNLRVGLYSNLTTTVNPLNWKVENNTFKLKDQVNGSDGTSTMGVETPIPTSDVFGDEPSRRLVRITDHGMIDKDLKKDDDGEALTSGRDPQDMAKSFSRYSLLFQQSLNITIPCNNEIRVGQVVKVVLPDVGPSEQGDGGKDQKQADQELSGIYLVRAMRHHFELGDGKNVTSLNLVRDSYGLN